MRESQTKKASRKTLKNYWAYIPQLVFLTLLVPQFFSRSLLFRLLLSLWLVESIFTCGIERTYVKLIGGGGRRGSMRTTVESTFGGGLKLFLPTFMMRSQRANVCTATVNRL